MHSAREQQFNHQLDSDRQGNATFFNWGSHCAKEILDATRSTPNPVAQDSRAIDLLPNPAIAPIVSGLRIPPHSIFNDPPYGDDLGPPVEANDLMKTLPYNSIPPNSPSVIERWVAGTILLRVSPTQLMQWVQLPGAKVVAYFLNPKIIKAKDSYGAEMTIKRIIEGSLGVSRVRVLISRDDYALEWACLRKENAWSIFLLFNLTAAVAAKLVRLEFLNTPAGTICIVPHEPGNCLSHMMAVEGIHFPHITPLVDEEVRLAFTSQMMSNDAFLEMVRGLKIDVPDHLVESDRYSDQHRLGTVLEWMEVRGVMISSGGYARSIFHLYLTLPASRDPHYYELFRSWFRQHATLSVPGRGYGKCIDWECEHCTSWSHPSALCPIINVEGFFVPSARPLNRY